MKSRPRPPRLGSFEALESRALLAHGGMNFAEFSFHAVRFAGEYQGPPRFVEQGLGQFHSARDTRPEPPSFQAGGTGHRGEERNQNVGGGFESGAVAITVTPVIVAPVTHVIVFINIPAPPTNQPQASPPLSNNSSGNNNNGSGRSQSLVTPNGNFGNSLLSSTAPPRSSTILRNSLDSLSIATSLTLPRAATTSDSADESEGFPADGDNETTPPESNEQDTVARLPPKDAAAAVQADNEEESELIELTGEDPLARSKRKLARKSTSPHVDSSAVPNSALRSQRQLDAPPLRQHDAWLEIAAAETGFSPVADDLIELLANDSSEFVILATHANSFESKVTIPIEATVGYFRASETDADQSSSENAPPAVVAAAGK